MKKLVLSSLFACFAAFSTAASAATPVLWNQASANLQWTYAPATMDYAHAAATCAAMNPAQAIGWHLPTVNEIGAALRNGLMDPTLNTAFGKEIAKWAYVWSRNQTNYANMRYVVNLQNWYYYEGNITQPYQVLCVKAVADQE